MKKIFLFVIPLLIFSIPSYARDAARDLQKMVGYTIVASDSINKITQDDYTNKYVHLSGGYVFKIDFLVLDPLPMTDVIIFAKDLPEDLKSQYKGKLPDYMLHSYKMLIDNEIYDATPQ